MLYTKTIYTKKHVFAQNLHKLLNVALEGFVKILDSLYVFLSP